MYLEINFKDDTVTSLVHSHSGWKCHYYDNGEVVLIRKIGDGQNDLGNDDSSYIRINQQNVEIKRGFSGEHPIFYAISKNIIIISDCAALIADKLDASLSLIACYEFIYFEYPGPGRTLYENVNAVLNGQHLIVETSTANYIRVTSVDSFSLPESEEDFVDEKRLAVKLREHITAAHAERCGELNGILLSGGIDSQVMSIALSRDLGLKDTFAATFSVSGAKQNEANDARRVAEQLGMQWFPVEIDPESEFDWSEVLRVNSPYIGALSMRQFLSQLQLTEQDKIVLFAGQDTRLHTPSLGQQDLWLWKYFYRFKKFAAAAAWCAQESGKMVKGLNESAYLKRLLQLFAYSPSFQTFLVNRYFHVRRFDFNNRDITFSKIFSEIMTSLGNPIPLQTRSAYNRVVRANWRRQYLFDIGHMVGACESSSLNCALPFYDSSLSQFSAKIPFSLATKMSIGRAGHAQKKIKVNKYLLRQAYKDDLDPSLIYRDKAVCLTNYLFLNGSLRSLLNRFFSDTSLVYSPMGISLHFPDLQRVCKAYDGRWAENDNWLCNIIFNALVVWSLMSTRGMPREEKSHFD